GHVSPLLIGHLQERPLAESLTAARHNRFIRAVRVLGPRGIAERLTEEEQRTLPREFPVGNICALCCALTSIPELKQAVDRVLNEEKMRRFVDVLWEINVQPGLRSATSDTDSIVQN